jgi:hypothetical protein
VKPNSLTACASDYRHDFFGDGYDYTATDFSDQETVARWPLATYYFDSYWGPKQPFPGCNEKVSAHCPQDGSQCVRCTTAPGQHFCYKPYEGQTLDSISKLFGLNPADLCKYNGMTDCGCLAGLDSFLKIPIAKLPSVNFANSSF